MLIVVVVVDEEEDEALASLLGDGAGMRVPVVEFAGRVRSSQHAATQVGSACRVKRSSSPLSLASDCSMMRAAELLKAASCVRGRRISPDAAITEP